jgi:5'-methylthioinosine phosphorylase
MVKTPYGAPSGSLTKGILYGHEIVFLARHGHQHTIAPHKINYRANLWALRSVGVKQVIAVAAVGGIAENCSPTMIVVPDQIIDYTYGREHTLYDGEAIGLEHIGFSYPYDEGLREELIKASKAAKVACVDHGTYAVTQGPRLETAAEIRRLSNDSCTIVGMTAMPEASIARELGLDYASLNMVVNWAPGIEETEIDFKQIEHFIEQGSTLVHKVLRSMFSHRASI